ncbi:hypothetical protein LCGC14_2681700, partial [marine sediment metagenome]
VGKSEYKKLEKYKVHPNQSFAEVIKNLLNNQTKKEVD